MECKKVGRPLAMTDEKLRKFERALMRGETIQKACLEAKICVRTYYDYCKRNPEYPHIVAQIRDQLPQKAEWALQKIIENNYSSSDYKTLVFVTELCLWIIERRKPELYGRSTSVKQTVKTQTICQYKQQLNSLSTDDLERIGQGDFSVLEK